MKPFAHHIFISYAHLDNQPLTAKQNGWVSRFHEALDSLLSMKLGEKAKIWRDDKLQGNDVFADEIIAQFDDVALLISVLTPRYLNSEWCTKELREFCQHAEQKGGLVVENKSRVLKVIKTPLDSEADLPAPLQKVLGYPFYAEEKGRPQEFDPVYGEQYEPLLLKGVNILAIDAAAQIKKMKAQDDISNKPAPEAEVARPAVYLAECSNDRRAAREMLAADLKLHGYTVLPDQNLPMSDEEGFRSAVQPLLERCRLSVHLVGGTYGMVPEGRSMKSVPVLQNELAAQLARNGTLQRVIWLPADTSSEQPQQQAFIERLQQDAEAQEGADLITGGLEALKATIHGKLEAIERQSQEVGELPAADGEGTRLVYLVCVEKDLKESVDLRKWLKRQGFEVRRPLFEGDAAAVRKTHQDLLASCDALILFYGAGDEAWKTTLLSDFRKLAAYRGSRSLPARSTYLAGASTADKEDMIAMEEADLINGLGGFDEALMADFPAAVGAAEERA